MFDAKQEVIEADRVTRFSITRDGAVLTFGAVLDLWESDAAFRGYWTRLLAGSPFAAYRWETPALTKATMRQPFEFVLLNCPRFCSRPTDRDTYAGYFSADETGHGVVTFANLRGDATLVVPSPRAEDDAYGHLAAFVRRAPASQRDALWGVVAAAVKSRVGERPVWISTAGGGVAWLHVRLDARPKYYGYAPYQSVSS